MKSFFAPLAVAVFSISTAFAGPLTFTFDEQGNGWFNGQFVQGSPTLDPVSGMTVMSYSVPGLVPQPGAFVASGDVIVLDPASFNDPTCSQPNPFSDNLGNIANWGAAGVTNFTGNCVSDLLRFFGNPGTVWVYSDAGDAWDSGFPVPPLNNNGLLVNLAITSEVGSEDANWVPETLPLLVGNQAQPGYSYLGNFNNPLGISYLFVSDSPEPGTVITLLSGLAVLGALLKRR